MTRVEAEQAAILAAIKASEQEAWIWASMTKGTLDETKDRVKHLGTALAIQHVLVAAPFIRAETLREAATQEWKGFGHSASYRELVKALDAADAEVTELKVKYGLR